MTRLSFALAVGGVLVVVAAASAKGTFSSKEPDGLWIDGKFAEVDASGSFTCKRVVPTGY